MNKKWDLIIIGGGSAGLAAAISANDNGIENILILEKDEYLGGILLQCIHNGFGLHNFKKDLTGPEYAHNFIEEVKKRKGIVCKTSSMVTKITNNLTVHYSSLADGYIICNAKAIICATGSYERTRGAINIPGSRPSGIMTAGLAQRYLNIDGYLVGSRVFILGSGDIGLIMARRMTLEGAKVLGVADIMPYSNGLNRNIVQCLYDYNIPLYLSHTVKEIVGKNRVKKIIVSKVDESFNFIEGSDLVFDIDTLLLSVGLIPSNPLLDEIGVLIHPKTKGPIVDENLQTSIPGIFSCGNSLHVHDLVDYVSNEGSVAGISAAKYIKRELIKEECDIVIESGKGVGYVLPTRINSKGSENIILKFRVTKPVEKGTILILNNDIIVKKIRKSYVYPAEMQTIDLPLHLIENGRITVEVSDNR